MLELCIGKDSTVFVPHKMDISQATGGALEDFGDGQASNELDKDPAPRRVNTARARAVSREIRSKREV